MATDDLIPTIELELPKKLQDGEYRRRFFLAEASAQIAKQLIALRKRRGFSQDEVAKLVGTGQPAISRVERADYHNWSFNTLRKLAEAMDARLRVVIEPAEDILAEYESPVAAQQITAGSRLADETKSDMLVLEQPGLRSRVPEVPETNALLIFLRTPPARSLVAGEEATRGIEGH